MNKSTNNQQRRRFSDEYKREIVERWEQAKTPEERQQILDDEDLYSSYIYSWKGQVQKGRDLEPRIEKLETENQELKNKVKRYKILLEAWKGNYESLQEALENMTISEEAKHMLKAHSKMFNTFELLEEEV